jgi:parvulin-like peptidyl-prolyl isomerase
MITVMRKHHKVLMIVITALVCISFSWYWNKVDLGQMGNGAVGKIYDRNISQVEFQRNARLLRLGSQLGMRELIAELTAGAQTEAQAFENFSWNLMVLRHEAGQLGIRPDTTEIANAVKALPAFGGERGFDLARYTDFTDHALAPMGFSEAQIEELAADQIILERVKKILSAGVNVPEAELRSSFEQAYAKMDVSVVRFRFEDFAKDAEINDADIVKYHEAQKAQLKTDEKRRAKFVRFGLTDEQKKLTGKARIDVLQKLADKANDFTEALQAKGADFDQAVAKFQLTPKETADFSQASPDPELASAPQLVQAAFALTKEAPNSAAIQTQDGFDVLTLLNVEPSRPLTLDEARPKIVEALKQQRVQQMVAMKASEVARQLRDELKSGKPVADAAAQAGVQVEKIPTFSLVDTLPGATPSPTPEPKNENPDMPRIKQAVSDLSPGGVSEYLSTPNGGLLVILEKREMFDPAKFEKSRVLIERQALQNKSQVVFYEWLRERRRAAGVQETKETNAQPAPS